MIDRIAKPETACKDLSGFTVLESNVLENILSCLPVGLSPWFYRTAAGAEIDLVLEGNSRQRYAIEIKRSLAPSLSKGFYLGCDNIAATKRFLVYPGAERFPVANDVMALPLVDLMNELQHSDVSSQ